MNAFFCWKDVLLLSDHQYKVLIKLSSGFNATWTMGISGILDYQLFLIILE
jgi:hypothetical protein